MSGSAEQPFELLGPLPEGKVAIEASAGTGKTYALAALATRFIAEAGVSCSELLIVTFTRAATDELRGKVRDRLLGAHDYLAHGWPEPTDDDLLAHLASIRTPELMDRLEGAVSEFDAATVTTIHGFAKQVLGALGVAAGTDPDVRLDVDPSGLIADTCADVLATEAVAGTPADLLPSMPDLCRAVALADGRTDLVLVPRPGQSGATPDQVLLTELVDRAARALAGQRVRHGTLTFEDVLTRLRDALTGAGADGAIESLRSRFRVVLIDEFQDTDRVQWDIFSTLFGPAGACQALVLVGDPKQAIYGFRGADVQTYLEAVGQGPESDRRALLTNWRSDGAALDAQAALFGRATFGDAAIPFVPVTPCDANRHRRLRTAEGAALPALSLRLAVGEGIGRRKNDDQLLLMGAAEKTVAGDLVDRVHELLEIGRLPDPETGSGTRPVRPPDIAVLVGRHTEASSIQAALAERGIPAVVSRGGSVLESAAAEQLRWFLNALARPADPRRVRMFALSWFVGRTATEVAALADEELEALQERLRRWSELLATHPVADVLAQVWSECGLVGRVLRSTSGDRDMTDLDHLAELLQAQAQDPTGRSAVAGLLAVLDAEPEREEDTEVDGDVAARRIASEADSVQIMTVWAAKGLEFPIVLVPTLWHGPSPIEPVIYLDPVARRRTLDLAQGKSWPDEETAKDRVSLAFAESTGERLRLLYVAMTRAQHHTVVWWANADRSSMTALARVLFARTDGVIDPELFGARSVRIPHDRKIAAALQPLVDAAPGRLIVETIDRLPSSRGRWEPAAPPGAAPELDVAVLAAPPDRTRRRWSFSAITNHASSIGVDPSDSSMADSGASDEGGLDEDEAVTASSAAPGPTPAQTARSHNPLADLPAGTAIGTLVHSVLEVVDFAAADLAAHLAEAVDEQLVQQPFDLTPVGATAPDPDRGRALLVDGLVRSLRTPLGPICDGLGLSDVARADRLNEVSFDLRLAEGGPAPSLRDIGALVLDHLGADDPLRLWAEGLAGGAVGVSLAGHLTGSIDLIMRIGDRRGEHRFVVADYKTNALHPRGAVPSPYDYGRDRMVGAMSDHDYPLQALLYSVALHRYLRWRLPGYEPARHLGGAAYLFLRGMTGLPDPGRSRESVSIAGVFAWPLPPCLVVGLSHLLDGRRAPVLVP